MKKLFSFLVILLAAFNAFCQQTVPTVEMADGLRSSGKIYVVVLVIAVIFAGLAIYLFSIDRKIKKIEDRIS